MRRLQDRVQDEFFALAEAGLAGRGGHRSVGQVGRNGR